mgnify:CR=1 FL=1
MKPTLYQRIIAPFVEPYVRYQHADILHAIRLGTAVILALLVNKITNLPHGEWTTITVFIILGLLQYQGAIYTKAKERVIGTLLGIGTALGVLWFNQNAGAWLWVDYALIGLLSGIIGYLAVRQLGYTGLLTGITMLMIVFWFALYFGGRIGKKAGHDEMHLLHHFMRDTLRSKGIHSEIN